MPSSTTLKSGEEDCFFHQLIIGNLHEAICLCQDGRSVVARECPMSISAFAYTTSFFRNCSQLISFVTLPFNNGVLLHTYNLMTQVHACLLDLNYCVILRLEFITNRSHDIGCRRRHQATTLLFNITADIICVNTADFRYKAGLMEEPNPSNPWGKDNGGCLIYTLEDDDL